jgi:hypothetical protein
MDIICINIHKSLNLPHYFMFSLPHYEYLRGLAILDENAIGANYGDCSRPDHSHSLRWPYSMYHDYCGPQTSRTKFHKTQKGQIGH